MFFLHDFSNCFWISEYSVVPALRVMETQVVSADMTSQWGGRPCKMKNKHFNIIPF